MSNSAARQTLEESGIECAVTGIVGITAPADSARLGEGVSFADPEQQRPPGDLSHIHRGRAVEHVIGQAGALGVAVVVVCVTPQEGLLPVPSVDRDQVVRPLVRLVTADVELARRVNETTLRNWVKEYREARGATSPRCRYRNVRGCANWNGRIAS
jgi:hypothetical protein